MMNVNFCSEQLYNEISLLKRQQYQLINDKDVTNLAYMSNTMSIYEKQKGLDRIFRNIIHICDSSQFVEDVLVFIRPINYMITTKGISQFYINELTSKLQLLKEEDHIYSDEQQNFLLMESNSDMKKVSLEERSIIIVIKINPNQIKKMISRIVEGQDSGSLLVNSNTGFLVMSDEDMGMFTLINSLVSDDNNISFIRKINWQGDSYWIITHSVLYTNMTLVSWISEHNITRFIRKYNILLII
jgi:hypothetical protein